MKRRNLSGIYIFEKFEDEESREPTCFEDCTEETQDKWLSTLEKEALVNLCKMLSTTLRKVGDVFDIVVQSEEENN
jgi:hypothetical protein